MCDTFVALKNATRDGSVIFGKNSDRDPNEAHELVLIPRANHGKNAEVDCTYISIPQVSETYAVLLSKPFWMWGAEMGANEHGVVIGNEALFTKVPYDKSPGLIGMDFLRLALERSSSAAKALDVIIGLLEKYGQGGNCGFSHGLFYHNGFLIVDRKEAWVLETAGKHWAAEKVKDIRSISNVISIGKTWDKSSDDLVSHAISKGWCKSEDEFHFSRCYSDFIFTKFSAGKHRICRTEELLREGLGEIDVPFAMQLLRDHGAEATGGWQPGKGLLGAEICMHASFGPVRISQTTGSMISNLTAKKDTHWVTGTSGPCVSIFKPVWIDSGLPDLGPAPTGTYEEATLWWRHENLHREVLRDYVSRNAYLQKKRDLLEEGFLRECREISDNSDITRNQFTEECFDKADQLSAEWLAAIKALPVVDTRPLLDRFAWRKFDRQAKRTV